MPGKVLFAVLLGVALVPAAYAAEGSFERTLNFSGSPSVIVSTGSGYIHVYPGPDNQLHVIGRVHSGSGWLAGDADRRVQEIVAAPPVVQSGNIITIGRPQSGSDLMHNISIDYEITTPAQTTLKAQTGSGSLEVGGIVGAVTAGSGSGSIHADNIGGNSHLETGSGSIHAEHVHGAVSAETGSGRLDLSLSAPGDVQARTGSGGIRLDGVSGGLRATAGSGSIEVAENPTAEWRIETGSGGIHLKIGRDARFNLNASTGSGRVQLDRPITIEGSLDQHHTTRHHVTGSVNGGGPTLRASTGSGSITMEER